MPAEESRLFSHSSLTECLKNTVITGGLVYAAFDEGKLKGFVAVEPKVFGNEHKYMDLADIHVSEDMRNKGIGASLQHDHQRIPVGRW